MSVTTSDPSSHSVDRADPIARIERTIAHAAHLLPAQGPITAFIHHNTLHAFEHLPFDRAVQSAAKTFGCEPYLSEDRYRQEFARGRFTREDVWSVLLEDLGDRAEGLVGRLGTRFHLRLAMLHHPLRTAPSAELRWLVAETDALTRFRDEVPPPVRRRTIEETKHWVMRDLRNGGDPPLPIEPSLFTGPVPAIPAPPDRPIKQLLAGLLERFGRSRIEEWSDATWESLTLHLLWRICHQGVHGVARFVDPPAPPIRHRDALLEATGEDTDRLVNDVLIPFCGAFVDQGFATWPLPGRERGFCAAFGALHRSAFAAPERWRRALPKELERLRAAGLGPLASIAESLDLLGVSANEEAEFLAQTLLALRGWGGMIHQMETRADRAVRGVPPGSLVEFVAVRLILERLAVAHVARESLGHSGPLDGVRHAARSAVPKRETVGVEQRAFQAFQLAQLLAWTPAELHRLSKAEWSRLVEEMEAFPPVERRRVFHHAYERRHRLRTLDAIAAHDRRRPREPSRPRFQVMCCIDEREESFRRHLEELSAEVETFGTAGFFGVAMYYRGAGDAHYAPLCPAVVTPRHYVNEEVVYTLEKSHLRRAKARRALGTAFRKLHLGSRTFAGGAVLTGLFGPLASAPLLARVLFPRLTARIRQSFGGFVHPPRATALQLERTEAEPGSAAGHVGFTIDEMAGIVERLLRETGLTADFSRLVAMTGHGSSSLNNPHESAHDCGACGGGRGGPNARAFAQMANDPRVRAKLAVRGLVIPRHTVFLGLYHNTCDDGVTYYDLDRLPNSHKDDFASLSRLYDAARERNAHERCRRFESAELALSPEAALRHVEARAEDLAQTRPEYGHATNAICIVGRRERTRGLFCDRRAFLTSYDPAQDDDESSILARILQAVFPVCAGISLEYYFSFVDSTGYGCGTKLPHNITALLGVMDGAESDLRTGLPWQMVEIHEPVRLLFVVETTPEAMLRVMARNPSIDALCRNAWVQLALLDPESSEIQVLSNGRFEAHQPATSELPEARVSADWFRGWRDHLDYAGIFSAWPAERRPAPREEGEV
ncbi:MAG: DUF2309 domain-containing protein [Planctomycetaceae bacterium]